MKDYRDPLKKLTQRHPIKIILFTLIVNTIYHIHCIKDFYFYLNANFPKLQRRFTSRNPNRIKAHYIRIPRHNPDRIAFLTLACLCTLGISLLPNQHYIIYWSIGWGSAFVGFTLYLTTRIILRKAYKTIKTQ